MQRVFRVLVGLLALLFIGYGLIYMFNPTDLAPLMGIEAKDVLGVSTLRADVCGMFLAIGLMLAAGLWRGDTTWFLAAAVLVGAIMLGRIVGIVADGHTRMVVANLVTEVVIVAILLGAHRRLNV